MTTKVWITRTPQDAWRSAVVWRAAGFDPVAAPLLDVQLVENSVSIPEESELIFTSANGVRMSGLIGDNRKVYAVGQATAKAARAIGFSNIVAGNKDWKSLSQNIEKTEKPIVHVSGSVVRGQLVETLKDRGFQASRAIVYETKPVTQWPIDIEEIDAVALYSPLAAQTLMALPPRDLSHLTAYCLSENVAAPVAGLTVRIAKEPNEMALIACSAASDG